VVLSVGAGVALGLKGHHQASARGVSAGLLSAAGLGKLAVVLSAGLGAAGADATGLFSTGTGAVAFFSAAGANLATLCSAGRLWSAGFLSTAVLGKLAVVLSAGLGATGADATGLPAAGDGATDASGFLFSAGGAELARVWSGTRARSALVCLTPGLGKLGVRRAVGPGGAAGVGLFSTARAACGPGGGPGILENTGAGWLAPGISLK
jgi:hypothetical protein